jgi:transcriptional regulator with XRE-family HTH domain
MQRKQDCASFASFGADTKEARIALGYTQKSFAEAIGIDPRYLANIENSGALPSLPVFYEIVRLCKLPVERYFYPEAETARDSKGRERVTLKLTVCPEKYLPIVESTINAAIKLDEPEDG